MTQSTLITGVAGFIGSHLADRLLQRGGRVVGIDNLCDFYDPALKRRNLADLRRHDRFAIVEADIRDRDAVMRTFDRQPIDDVIHIAAMAGVRPSIENPKLYTEVNLDGSVNLLDAAAQHNAQRFLFASSSSVYGNNDKVPFAEADPVDHPISPYAATKRSGELIAHAYHHLYNLPVACLRFFTVFGPRQRPDLAIAKFLRLVRDDKSIPVFGDGSMSRDYTYIDDIVDGVLAAQARIDAHGYRIWNLGGSSPVKLSDMIDAIERVTGKTARIDRQPLQPGDVRRTSADLTRSAAELGFTPTVSLEEGIARQWAAMDPE